MKTNVATVLAITLVLAGGTLVSPALAGTISYTTGNWSQQFPSSITVPNNAPWGPNGYPGDTVTLQGYTGTLDLTPGIYVLQIGTLLWDIDYTYGGSPEPWPDITFNFATSRNIDLDGGAATGALGQPGALLVNYYNDYLGLLNGTKISLFVSGYEVDITPIGLASVGGSNFDGSNPWTQPSRDIMAQFEVKTVPEPSMILLLGIAIGAVCLISFRRG